ncbi:MAG: hypothetical protein IJ772_05570 [Bacilli bacterium]|nr:hypothetical protein [Bacilli bacterium]
MDRILKGEDKINEFLKTYNPAKDERLVFRFEKDKAYIIYPEEYIKFDGKWCKYLGFVNSPEEVGNISCFYRLGRGLYHKKQNLVLLNEVKGGKTKKEDTSDFLDIVVKDTDNELMVICKELLKGMRVNTFKSLFTSQSDFNNVRREITNGNGQLTWNRFLLITDLLGFDHSVAAIKRDGEAVGFNTSATQRIKETELGKK